MDRERASASEAKIPEAWIGQEVMIETTEALSSDLRAAAPVYLEEVNDKGIVMLVTRHHGQSQFSRYFYPWSVVVLPLECGWLDTSCRGGRALRAASYGFMSPFQVASPSRMVSLLAVRSIGSSDGTAGGRPGPDTAGAVGVK